MHRHRQLHDTRIVDGVDIPHAAHDLVVDAAERPIEQCVVEDIESFGAKLRLLPTSWGLLKVDRLLACNR